MTIFVIFVLPGGAGPRGMEIFSLSMQVAQNGSSGREENILSEKHLLGPK